VEDGLEAVEAPGRAGPQSSSSEESGSESGPVGGRSERGAGGGAGPWTRLGGGAGPAVVGGGAGPVESSSSSESRGISSLFAGAPVGGSEGPIDRFTSAGATIVLFATVGERAGPIVGAGRGDLCSVVLLFVEVGALGPKSSSESSPNGISSSLSLRDVFGGGEPSSESSSRLRFWRCGGSCGPIDAMVLATSPNLGPEVAALCCLRDIGAVGCTVDDQSNACWMSRRSSS
jgi:hypothetical protein